ncbi:MAG: long-chain fatty acid--CoA ligase [Novosphingobium sp.]|nr:long-chain fatty acid--CoA ligase [Novosphingobium sp.]
MDRHLDKRADQTAIIWESDDPGISKHITYLELSEQVNKLANVYKSLGIGKGDRVGLFLPNVPTYVAAYFGAMIAGATVVNFSPLYTVDELSEQVADSGARLLVTIDSSSLLPTALEVLSVSLLDTLVVARLAKMLPWAQSFGLRLFRRSELTAIPRQADVIEWTAMLANGTPRPVAIDPHNDLALLQYTGGTTGRPKGAMLTHQNLSACARQVQSLDDLPGQRDVIVGVLPFFHVFANATILHRTLLNGGCIAMLPRFRASQCLETITRTRATAMPGVPTMYQALLDHPDLAKTDFSSLRACISGGAPLPAPVKQAFEQRTGARLFEGYGLTETSGVVTCNPYAQGEQPGTIGQPTPGTRLRLLDKEDATRDAPPGEPGELAVNGPQVMRGYWNLPEADAAAFAVREGERWLRTGDIATIDGAGFVKIVDRSKDMISVGGFKVFPSQVEKVMLQCPAVREVLVIGVPDSYRGESPRAFVVCQPDSDESCEQLAQWLNSRVGKHERVDKVVVRDSLPKTMVGKLDRKALREEVLRGSE